MDDLKVYTEYEIGVRMLTKLQNQLTEMKLNDRILQRAILAGNKSLEIAAGQNQAGIRAIEDKIKHLKDILK
jgi:hypothetical protein